jgi:hypothetical protein
MNQLEITDGDEVEVQIKPTKIENNINNISKKIVGILKKEGYNEKEINNIFISSFLAYVPKDILRQLNDNDFDETFQNYNHFKNNLRLIKWQLVKEFDEDVIGYISIGKSLKNNSEEIIIQTLTNNIPLLKTYSFKFILNFWKAHCKLAFEDSSYKEALADMNREDYEAIMKSTKGMKVWIKIVKELKENETRTRVKS